MSVYVYCLAVLSCIIFLAERLMVDLLFLVFMWIQWLHLDGVLTASIWSWNWFGTVMVLVMYVGCAHHHVCTLCSKKRLEYDIQVPTNLDLLLDYASSPAISNVTCSVMGWLVIGPCKPSSHLAGTPFLMWWLPAQIDIQIMTLSLIGSTSSSRQQT